MAFFVLFAGMTAKKIGWIGTGVMGASMARHLLEAGHEVAVHTRTKGKASALIERVAGWSDSPAEAAEGADFTFAIVGYPTDVEETFLGEHGVLQTAGEGSVVVDMTTSEPALAERIAEEAEKKGVAALDAPVSGGDLGACNACLAIMVGGKREPYENALPLFKLMGKNVALFGPAGSGQRVKMSNQILIATTMIGTVESLLYAVRSGLDPDAVIDLIGSGAAGCWSINNLGRRIVKRDFAPGFYVKHFVKDMGIALRDAKRMKLKLPGLSLAKDFYDKAVEAGMENDGTHGLYKLFESLDTSD